MASKRALLALASTFCLGAVALAQACSAPPANITPGNTLGSAMPPTLVPVPPPVVLPDVDASCDAAACSVSWGQDIFPKMAGVWACATSPCHANTSNKPFMVATNGTTTYQNLVAYGLPGVAVRYIQPCDPNPDDSNFICNVAAGDAGCGAIAMPETPGVMTDADRALLAAWIACGAPNN